MGKPENHRVSRWWRKWGSWRKGSLKFEYGVLILPPSCTFVKLTEISRVKILNKHCITLNFSMLLGSTNLYFSPSLGGFLPLFLQIHFFFLLLQSLPHLPLELLYHDSVSLHYILSPGFRRWTHKRRRPKQHCKTLKTKLKLEPEPTENKPRHTIKS